MSIRDRIEALCQWGQKATSAAPKSSGIRFARTKNEAATLDIPLDSPHLTSRLFAHPVPFGAQPACLYRRTDGVLCA